MRDIKLPKFSSQPNEPAFFYCFDVFTKQGIRYFCSSNNTCHFNGNEYVPDSSLNLKEVIFNENATDYAIITGIFEAAGINRETDILGQKISCHIALGGKLYQYFTFSCSNFAKGDLDFALTLEPETMKLSKNLLLRYSKTCRADFGDHKCQVNPQDYLQYFAVTNIENQTIFINYQQPSEDFFTGGTAIFSVQELPDHHTKIIAHQDNQIILSSPLPSAYLTVAEIALIPTCNKSFISCCKKFNNAVNFRGEPTLPDENFILN